MSTLELHIKQPVEGHITTQAKDAIRVQAMFPDAVVMLKFNSRFIEVGDKSAQDIVNAYWATLPHPVKHPCPVVTD